MLGYLVEDRVRILHCDSSDSNGADCKYLTKSVKKETNYMVADVEGLSPLI